MLAAARNGQERAWKQLFDIYAPPVAGYVRAQGAGDVDDLVGEVFYGVFRSIGSFTGTEAQFRSWVFVIAHHRVVDERRQRFRATEDTCWELPEPDISRSTSAGTESTALEHLDWSRLTELCGRLAPDQREVLLLRIIGDLSINQIAELLGRSSGATKALQRRGLAALHKELSRSLDFTAGGVPL